MQKHNERKPMIEEIICITSTGRHILAFEKLSYEVEDYIESIEHNNPR
jgi:hypothetical protein